MNKATGARRAALRAVRQVRTRDAFVRDILPGILDDLALDEQERAFATRLAVGCVQASGTLDEALDRAMRKPSDAKPNVRDALKVSVYEMLFLGKDAYAAVDQGVDLAASVTPKVRGLANAVLRRVAVLAQDFPWGDPHTDLNAAARSYGFPEWLAHDLALWMGEDEARRFMQVSNEQAPVFVSVCAMRAQEDAVQATLSTAGIGFSAVADIPGCLKLASAHDVTHPVVATMIADGSLIVADAAAQAVAVTAARHAEASLLDACAGRGTKALLIQSARVRACGMQLDRYVTVDNVASKRPSLLEHAAACGADISRAVVADATDLDAVLGTELFDEVLVDAPCTGLGTLRRHPEIRWRIQPEDIVAAADLDARLLASAATHVAPGGSLVYATCTVSPQENQQAIEHFLATSGGGSFVLEPQGETSFFASVLTSDGCDAHFCAVLRKKASAR